MTREFLVFINKGRSSGSVQLIISLPGFPVAILIIFKPYGGGTAEAFHLFPILIQPAIFTINTKTPAETLIQNYSVVINKIFIKRLPTSLINNLTKTQIKYLNLYLV
jgi:hypothetical protein